MIYICIFTPRGAVSFVYLRLCDDKAPSIQQPSLWIDSKPLTCMRWHCMGKSILGSRFLQIVSNVVSLWFAFAREKPVWWFICDSMQVVKVVTNIYDELQAMCAINVKIFNAIKILIISYLNANTCWRLNYKVQIVTFNIYWQKNAHHMLLLLFERKLCVKYKHLLTLLF